MYMAMSIKQMILATAKGEHLDKLPYVPRIDVWYNYNVANNAFPERYEGWKQTEIMRDQGAGTGQYRLFHRLPNAQRQDLGLAACG